MSIDRTKWCMSGIVWAALVAATLFACDSPGGGDGPVTPPADVVLGLDDGGTAADVPADPDTQTVDTPADPSGVALVVEDAVEQGSLAGHEPQDGRRFVVVSVRLENGAEAAPLPVAFSHFTLASDNGLLYLASDRSASTDAPCAADILVAAGASHSCQVAFELPLGEKPTAIHFDAGDGRAAEAGVTTTPYTPPADSYAVMVQDAPDFACSEFGWHGADIDMVRLVDDSTAQLIGNFEFVTGNIPTTDCGGLGPNQATDPSKAVGYPTGLLEDCVSLNGGFIVGEFYQRPRITQEHRVVVHEVGQYAHRPDGEHGVDEPYQVFVATDMACESPTSPCAVKIGDGVGESSFPLAGTGI